LLALGARRARLIGFFSAGAIAVFYQPAFTFGQERAASSAPEYNLDAPKLTVAGRALTVHKSQKDTGGCHGAKVIDVVGISKESFASAAENAVAEAAKTVRGLKWARVAELKMELDGSKISHRKPRWSKDAVPFRYPV
jgi:flavin-binding protein dodecin